MDKKALEARRAYKRAWAKAHPDKVKAQQERYWKKRAAEGQPICAATGGDSRGYFIAANKQEMRAYCDSIYKRCGELFKTRRACLKTLENLPDGDAPDTVKN